MFNIQRRLNVTGSTGAVPVDVSISAPTQSAAYWACSYSIGWPEGARVAEARGADGLQAVYLAMESVGIALYSSPHHRSGRLYWQKPGRGYGFPVPKSARDVLVGDDRELQV
jgi:hypothetical protein